jgi:hypothetical protein
MSQHYERQPEPAKVIDGASADLFSAATTGITRNIRAFTEIFRQAISLYYTEFDHSRHIGHATPSAAFRG